VKKVVFLVLICLGFKVSADQFWIDPRRTYIVNKRLWKSYENNIRNWQSEKTKLQISLDVEYDPDRLLSIQNKISFFQSEKNKLKTEIGQPVNFNIKETR